VHQVKAMVGIPVSKYLAKHSLGLKMSGNERWTNADKEFELFSGYVRWLLRFCVDMLFDVCINKHIHALS
jgi:hypothetical protein